MKKNFIKVGLPVLILFLGIGIFMILAAVKPEPEKSEKTARPLSVYTEAARQSDISLRVSTEGEVRARTEVTLVAQVAGRIVSVSSEFTEGGIVLPGVPLISIEDTDYQLAVSQAQAAVAEAEVGVQEALATANVARKQLRNSSSASPLALKKPQVAQARARLEAARASLSLARLNLGRTKIALPFNGRVTERSVGIGQYVSPGTSLGRAFATNVVEVRVPLDDGELASLDLPIGFIASEDSPIAVSLSAEVAGKVQHWRGKLVRLDASIDSKTRTIFGQIEVESPYVDNVSQHNMPLAVGLYVKAEIAGRNIKNATIISRKALRAGDSVFVIDDDNRLDIRHVGIVHSTATRAVIASGVEPGDRVIVSSIRNPIPGMKLSGLGTNEIDTVALGGDI